MLLVFLLGARELAALSPSKTPMQCTRRSWACGLQSRTGQLYYGPWATHCSGGQFQTLTEKDGMARFENWMSCAVSLSSEATAKDHVKIILKKLETDDRTHAATEATRRGIIHF
jgi:hypothetical protein